MGHVICFLILISSFILSAVLPFIKHLGNSFITIREDIQGSQNIDLLSELHCDKLKGFTTPISFSIRLNNIHTAWSAFRLQGYNETGKITKEQGEFREAAVFTLSGSFVFLSYYFCNEVFIVLFLISCPQVAVLWKPFIIEYNQEFLFRLNLIRNLTVEEKSDSASRV